MDAEIADWCSVDGYVAAILNGYLEFMRRKGKLFR